MKKAFYLTQDGIGELKAEHTQLISERGPVAERIKTAREFGDLTENAEYASARQEQERMESRILEIDNILQNAEIITKPQGANKTVHMGSQIQLKGDRGKLKVFQIVGTVEADPLNGKLSDESPIGIALMGKKEGDSINLKEVVYKITEIS